MTSSNIARLRTDIELLRAENKELKAAVRGLLPRGWRDGTMDHMKGIKDARHALRLYTAAERRNFTAYHGDIDGDFNY